MRDFEIEKKLHKVLQKLFRKDRKRYEIVWKKINQIVNDVDIEHYKNLRAPLNDFKRVHVDSSFVLIFRYDRLKDKISFYEFEHHDKVYGKKLGN